MHKKYFLLIKILGSKMCEKNFKNQIDKIKNRSNRCGPNILPYCVSVYSLFVRGKLLHYVIWR